MSYEQNKTDLNLAVKDLQDIDFDILSKDVRDTIQNVIEEWNNLSGDLEDLESERDRLEEELETTLLNYPG